MRSKAELTAAIRRDPQAVAVINTRSRRAAAAHLRLRALLAAHAVPLTAELPVADPAALPDVLQAAVAMNPNLLIVGGGDGTMATVVDYLAYADIALGVLPLGTTNNFARSLGLPLDLRGAVRTIGSGVVADVDLGHVTGAHSAGDDGGDYGDGDLFANLASIGLSVQVAHRTPHALKRRLGRAAYGLTGLRALPGHHPFHATLITPGGQQDFWTHQLNIANGRYHAGRAIARDASIDDHQLVVYRLGDHLRTGLSAAMISQLIRGARRDLATIPFLVTPTVDIHTDPPLDVDVDGEVHGTTPITVRTAPEALRVLVPADFRDR
jgi:YegS/Rv2252/BmrU family lipid kinase